MKSHCLCQGKAHLRRCASLPSCLRSSRPRAGAGERHQYWEKTEAISSSRGRRARRQGVGRLEDERVRERSGRRRRGRVDGATAGMILMMMGTSTSTRMARRARLPSVFTSRLCLLHRHPTPILDRAACFDHDHRRACDERSISKGCRGLDPLPVVFLFRKLRYTSLYTSKRYHHCLHPLLISLRSCWDRPRLRFRRGA